MFKDIGVISKKNEFYTRKGSDMSAINVPQGKNIIVGEI